MDVDGREGLIRIRPKTTARTWKFVTKKVANIAGLEAKNIIREYEARVEKGPEDLLFKNQPGGVLEAARVRDQLRRVVVKLGMNLRLTTHAARKGAAVESVLAGAPLPVVQAWGSWESIDSLQDYVGKAIRVAISPLEWLNRRVTETWPGKHRGRESWCSGVAVQAGWLG